MRGKIPLLEEAFTGFFTDHHAFLLKAMVTRIDMLDADIVALDAKIEDEIRPKAGARPLFSQTVQTPGRLRLPPTL